MQRRAGGGHWTCETSPVICEGSETKPRDVTEESAEIYQINNESWAQTISRVGSRSAARRYTQVILCRIWILELVTRIPNSHRCGAMDACTMLAAQRKRVRRNGTHHGDAIKKVRNSSRFSNAVNVLWPLAFYHSRPQAARLRLAGRRPRWCQRSPRLISRSPILLMLCVIPSG